MPTPRKIELLSPARNADTGMEAIRHGADAVYIGAPKFGAREAAANSIGDIRRLAEYAHVFGAKVYATLNTILYDSELEEARRMAFDLYDAGVDALLVQDAAFLQGDFPPMALHASTQCDNRTPEKILRLYSEGFTTAVLARELSASEIKEIHEKCPGMRLEAFVHGALCVSYSGRCYASQHCFKRSANRGECAQFCRLPFDLETENGQKILKQKHLLSLRDLNRTEGLERLLDSGISSLKIEGRLKDCEYVKNITAWYRTKLDEIFARRKEYIRASAGTVTLNFKPQPEKSFNRGFTDFFLNGRSMHMACPATPKSIGEPVGEIREVGTHHIIVSGHKAFSNGDGLCYFNGNDELRGFRVNRAEGCKLYPAAMPQDAGKHTRLYRNHDEAFSQLLAKPSAERRLKINFRLSLSETGFELEATDGLSRSARTGITFPHEKAQRPQRKNIEAQLSKLGNTPFCIGNTEIEDDSLFIPSSLIADARRKVTDTLVGNSRNRTPQPPDRKTAPVSGDVDYSGNVANKDAGEFYRLCGATNVAPAWEITEPQDAPIMTCRYCVRNELGMCLKKKGSDRSYLFLKLSDGKRFRLDFDCKNCIMKIYAEK